MVRITCSFCWLTVDSSAALAVATPVLPHSVGDKYIAKSPTSLLRAECTIEHSSFVDWLYELPRAVGVGATNTAVDIIKETHGDAWLIQGSI